MDFSFAVLVQWFLTLRAKFYAWGTSAFGNTPFDDGGNKP